MTTKEDRKEALTVLATTVASSEASASDRDNVQCKVPHKLCFTVVVFGASGDLAKKKTFPALFLLYSRGYAVSRIWPSYGPCMASALTAKQPQRPEATVVFLPGQCNNLQLGFRFLPANLSIMGYARSKLSKQDLQEKVKPHLKGDKDLIDEFLDVLEYEAGPYDKAEGYQKVWDLVCFLQF